MIVSLPWPVPALSPNARGHWAIKARAVREARTQAAWLTKAEARGRRFAAPLTVKVTLCPPRKGVNADNAIASAKAALDGVGDGIGVPDEGWNTSFVVAEPRKGGVVIVEISERREGFVSIGDLAARLVARAKNEA